MALRAIYRDPLEILPPSYWVTICRAVNFVQYITLEVVVPLRGREKSTTMKTLAKNPSSHLVAVVAAAVQAMNGPMLQLLLQQV